jgi:hypothetical protein
VLKDPQTDFTLPFYIDDIWSHTNQVNVAYLYCPAVLFT